MAAGIRRNLVKSLEEMQKNQEQYGFGPTQLNVLGILLKKTRRAKSEKDLFDVWRKTCYLKNAKK
jgi:DNA-binding winged helix-turn-helix (wHTH) protein